MMMQFIDMDGPKSITSLFLFHLFHLFFASFFSFPCFLLDYENIVYYSISSPLLVI